MVADTMCVVSRPQRARTCVVSSLQTSSPRARSDPKFAVPLKPTIWRVVPSLAAQKRMMRPSRGRSE
jgi:hypothetical protein